jgi:tRNA-specific adenosine deaminase 1
MLVAPTESAYISGIILPEEEISQTACDRAFGDGPTGRMRELVGRSWKDEKNADDNYGYRFRPFNIIAVPTETVQTLWHYRKPRPEKSSSAKGLKKNSSKPGNVSAVWVASPSQNPVPFCSCSNDEPKLPLSTASTAIMETIINGVKQGNKVSSITARGASVLSRAKMWNMLRDILVSGNVWDATHEDRWDWRKVVESQTYENFKRPSLDRMTKDSTSWLRVRMSAMEDTKRFLRPWIPNRGDENWSIAEVLADSRNKFIRTRNS